MIQRLSTEIASDIALYRAARTALVTGERVESLSRDGRGMRLATLSLNDIESAISRLEREYAAAVNSEAGGAGRKRTFFPVSF